MKNDNGLCVSACACACSLAVVGKDHMTTPNFKQSLARLCSEVRGQTSQILASLLYFFSREESHKLGKVTVSIGKVRYN